MCIILKQRTIMKDNNEIEVLLNNIKHKNRLITRNITHKNNGNIFSNSAPSLFKI